MDQLTIRDGVIEVGCRADLAVFDPDVFATGFTVAGGSAVVERAGRPSWDVAPSARVSGTSDGRKVGNCAAVAAAAFISATCGSAS
jgi:cytosine/adenosine deaminase-related metal-dependent hydrolase